MKDGELRIGTPRVSTGPDGTQRVSAEVDRREVFFESDRPLVPAPEAFLSAFLLPAMARGQALRIDAPVCELWLRNVETIRSWAGRRWGFGGGEIRHEGARHLEPQSDERGLFFGGGVDSCFTLHEELGKLGCLINTEGFDIKLADPARLRRARERNQAVADASGLTLLTLRTDLRRHPALRRLHWRKQFAAANAATAHVLGRHVRSVLLAGWGTSDSRDCGSHPEVDASWSSGAVSFRHHGEAHTRAAKVAAISGWPVARQHVRVCYEHRREELNCGECEKCLRTRLEFLAAGTNGDLSAFPSSPIAPLLDRLPGLGDHVDVYYHEIADQIQDPAIRAAVDRLLVRSPRWQARKRRYKELKQALRRLLGLRRHVGA